MYVYFVYNNIFFALFLTFFFFLNKSVKAWFLERALVFVLFNCIFKICFLVFVSLTQEAASRERHNSDRAHRIAQEKLKLMEKEKQIAEKLRTLKKAMVEKEAGKHPAVEPVLDVSKNSSSKWKSQDVIRIDKDANPDISVKQRRKSLLEMNPSTTPNIPLTPRRSISVSNVEKENVATETSALDVKPGDRESNGDMSSSFRMPSGTQLSNFCKLQVRRTYKFKMFIFFCSMQMSCMKLLRLFLTCFIHFS